MERSANFYIGKIANPHQIRRFLVKFLGEKVLTDTFLLLVCRRPWRLDSAHFWQFHLLHQPVHPTFADGNAMLPREAKRHLSAGRRMPQVLVVGAAVDSEHPAEDGDGMLRGQGVDGV